MEDFESILSWARGEPSPFVESPVGQIIEITLVKGEPYQLSAALFEALSFDGRYQVSQLIIKGQGAGEDGTVLQPSPGVRRRVQSQVEANLPASVVTAFGLSSGAPPIRLENLRMEDFHGRSAVAVLNGGSLEVVSCSFVNISASAIVVHAGGLSVRSSSFLDNGPDSCLAGKNEVCGGGTADACDGGAIHACAGNIDVDGTIFRRNTARNGGALFAGNGATISVTDSLFKDNKAREKGGVRIRA